MAISAAYVSFYDMLANGQFTQRPAAGQYLTPFRAGFDEDEGGIPQGWAEFRISAETIPDFFGTQNTIWNYIQRGRVCVVYAYETPAAGMIPVSTFIIQNISDDISGTDMTVRIDGPSLLGETNNRKLWDPIGALVTKMALLTTPVQAPRNRTIDQAAPIGQNWVRVNNPLDINKGDEIRFHTDNGALNILRVTGVDTDSRKINISTALLDPIAVNRPVDFRTRGLKLDHPEYFADGDRVGVWVTSLPDATLPVFWATIEQIETPQPDDEDQTKTIWLKTGIPAASHTNQQVFKHDYSTPTSADVEKTVAPLLTANGGLWGIYMQPGRTAQTSQAPNGATVYETLTQIAKTNGETFRLQHLSVDGLPTRVLHWIHTPTFNGIELITPTPANVRAVENDANKAVITSISAEDDNTVYTVAYVTGGKQGEERLTLRECDAATIDWATSLNFIPEISANDIIPDAIRNHTLSFTQGYGRIETGLDYPDIVPTDNTPQARTAAANKMLRQAVHEMYRYMGQRRTINVTCIAKKTIRAGDLIALTHVDGGHFGQRSYQYNTPGNYLFVVSASSNLEDDVLTYNLTLSTLLWGYWSHQETDASVMAGLIATVNAMRTAANVDPSGNGIVTNPGGGAVQTVYTAGNGISIVGNAISVNVPALAGPGLDGTSQLYVNPTELLGNALRAEGGNTRLGVEPINLAGTHLLAETANKLGINTTTLATTLAGNGLGATGGVMAVNVTTPIQIANDALFLKLGNYPGLIIDGTGGLSMNTPLDVSGMTANSLGASHSHAVVTATDGRLATNANAAHKTILAANYQGGLGLTSLSTPLIRSAQTEDLTLQPYTKLAKLLGNLQLTDGNANVKATAGQLSLTATDPGTLATATFSLRGNNKVVFENWAAGWGIQSSNYVSQLTGWGISHGTSGGHGDFRSFFADELRVRAFIADLEQALAGGQIITKSVAILSRSLRLPDAVNATVKIYVEDLPGWPGVPVFDQRVNDRLRITYINRDTGLDVIPVWGEIQRTSFTNEGSGEQSWDVKFTYLGNSSAAAGKTIGKGAIVLDYGREPHAHFYEVSASDPSGAPYARAGSITEFNANGTIKTATIHFQGGALSAFPTLGDEVGIFAGDSLQTRHGVITNRRGELHGIALTLYDAAGRDNLRIRLHGISLETQNVAGGAITAKYPTSDLANGNIRRSSGVSALYSYVNNAPNTGQPDATYLSNDTADTALLKLGFAAYPVNAKLAVLKAFVAHEGTSTGDDVALYAQLYNGTTPVSNEVLVDRFSVAHTATGGSFITVPFTNISPTWDPTTLSLQFNWRYEPLNRNATIKADPAVPSIAVGNPLPTGTAAGGAGFWAGSENGTYKARIGDPLGARMLYDGTGLTLSSGSAGGSITLNPTSQSIAMGQVLPTGINGGGAGFWAGLQGGAYTWRVGGTSGVAPRIEFNGEGIALRNTAGTAIITFEADGSSWFAGPMALAAAGGIYQGTGTFASPANGLKLWNQAGQGRLSTFEGGIQRVTLRHDRGLEINSSGSFSERSAITFANGAGGTVLGGLYGYTSGSTQSINLRAANATQTAYLTMDVSATSNRTFWGVGNAYFDISSTSDYALLTGVDFYIRERGLAVGYTATPALNRGQIASDFAGEHDFNALVLQDTVKIAHGMTSVLGTATYGALGKNNATAGGLLIRGAGEASVGARIHGYATNQSSATDANALAPVYLDAYARSGTTATALSDGNNLLVVGNASAARLVLKGNGALWSYNGGSWTAMDDWDDVALLRTLNRHLDPKGTQPDTVDAAVTYNADDLAAAGLIDGEMLNQSGLISLLTGAVWQLHRRLNDLERRSASEGDQR